MNGLIKKIVTRQLWASKEFQHLELSKENLSSADYESLEQIIQKTAFLQSITLPPLTIENVKPVLEMLDRVTKKNSILKDIKINLSAVPQSFSAPFLEMLDTIKSRMERNRKRVFAVHGGGNIGLGLLADVVNRSELTYQIVATSNDTFLADTINATNSLFLEHKRGIKEDKTHIKNVTIVSRQASDVINLYVNASIAAICLTPDAFNHSVKFIAEGLIERYRQDGTGLKILVLMNLPNCHEYVLQQLTGALQILSPRESFAILENIEIIPTMVDRIVTKRGVKEIQAEFDRGCLDEKLSPETQIKEWIKKNKAEVALFKAEKNFALFVPDNFPEANQFDAMRQVKDLKQLEQIKNKFINGPHAILAWLGGLADCQTIAEAIVYPGIREFIEKLMIEEIGPTLQAEFPNLTTEELDYHRKLFIKRCMESIEDPVKRVGRDPLRKIDAKERIRGTIELLQKHKLNISTTRLEQGISAALLYAIKGKDTENTSCRIIVDMFKRNKNNIKPILCYNGDTKVGRYTGLDPNKDKVMIDNILSHLGALDRHFTQLKVTRSQSLDLNKEKHRYSFFNLVQPEFSLKRIDTMPALTHASSKS